MQLKELGNNSDAERRRIAEIFARVRIEQSIFAAAAPVEGDADRLVGILGAIDSEHCVFGI